MVHIMSFELFFEEDRQRERELLATYDLDVKFFNKLGVNIKQIVPERACYRIETNKGFFCLKKMNYSFLDIYLMQEITIHLKEHGFSNVSEIVRQPDGGILVPYLGSEYYLTHWMDGRESDYLNLADIKQAAEELARLHLASEGFSTRLNTNTRRLFGRWDEGFLQKLREIRESKRLVTTAAKENDNLQIFVDYLNSCEKETENAISLLERSSYSKLCARDEKQHGFIHHDYGLYNIIHTFSGETFVGELENAAFDIRMHDLGHFIFKLMRRRGWDIEIAMNIINYYNDIFKLEKEDYEALCVYLSLPQDFKQFQKLYYSVESDIEDLEALERVNISSEYSTARREFLQELEKNSGM